MNIWKHQRIGPAPHIAVDHAGDGDLVIFLHGIGGNRTNWHDQLPEFAKYFHAVTWDARGYGDSDDYEGPLQFSDYTHDVVRVLDYFNAAKAHVVGLSMGGRIALDFAEKYPSRLLTLTLCDTHRGFSNFSDEKKKEFIRLRKEPLTTGGEPKDIAVPVAKSLIGPKAPPEIFQRLIDSLSALHKESYIKSIEATVMSDGHRRVHEIAVPTHVVVGAEDRLTTPAMAQEMVDLIPGAKLTIVPDAGHLSNIEAPEFFNREVIGFILQQRDRA